MRSFGEVSISSDRREISFRFQVFLNLHQQYGLHVCDCLPTVLAQLYFESSYSFVRCLLALSPHPPCLFNDEESIDVYFKY